MPRCVHAPPHPCQGGEGFETIEVPRSWELSGHGQPVYTNCMYPFECNPPFVPIDENYAGTYERSFTVDASWGGRRVMLRLDGVGSACFVFVDGHEVGYRNFTKKIN